VRARKAVSALLTVLITAALAPVVGSSPAHADHLPTPPVNVQLTVLSGDTVRVSATDTATNEGPFLLMAGVDSHNGYNGVRLIVDHRSGQPQATGYRISGTATRSYRERWCFVMAVTLGTGYLTWADEEVCAYLDPALSPVAVPHVRYSSRESAEDTVREAGFIPVFTGSTATDAFVVSQTPASGTMRVPGDRVTLLMRQGEVP
jgi:hypothetical protein